MPVCTVAMLNHERPPNTGASLKVERIASPRADSRSCISRISSRYGAFISGSATSRWP